MRKKVRDVVSEIIAQNPLYELLMSTNLVNYNALARQISVPVSALMGKDARVNTVAKALTDIAPKVARVPSVPQFDVALDTGIVEKERELRELAELDPQKVYLAVFEGGKVRTVEQAGTDSLPSNQVLLRVTFRGNRAAYHPFWMLFNSLGLEVDHLIRHDNSLYIFMDRKNAFRALPLLDNLSRQAQRSGTQPD